MLTSSSSQTDIRFQIWKIKTEQFQMLRFPMVKPWNTPSLPDGIMKFKSHSFSVIKVVFLPISPYAHTKQE